MGRHLWPLPVWVYGGREALCVFIDLKPGAFLIELRFRSKTPKVVIWAVGGEKNQVIVYIFLKHLHFRLWFFFFLTDELFLFQAPWLIWRLSYGPDRELKPKKGSRWRHAAGMRTGSCSKRDKRQSARGQVAAWEIGNSPWWLSAQETREACCPKLRVSCSNCSKNTQQAQQSYN